MMAGLPSKVRPGDEGRAYQILALGIWLKLRKDQAVSRKHQI